MACNPAFFTTGQRAHNFPIVRFFHAGVLKKYFPKFLLKNLILLSSLCIQGSRSMTQEALTKLRRSQNLSRNRSNFRWPHTSSNPRLPQPLKSPLCSSRFKLGVLRKISVKFEKNQKDFQSKLFTIDENVPIDQEAFRTHEAWREKLAYS